jgi:hypothetical protein
MLIQRLSRSHHRRVWGGAYSERVLSYSPTAYWPLWEASGSAAACLINSEQNGAYTGVTLGQTGIGDGETCPLFDGANDYLDIYSLTLRAAFPGAEGTLLLWFKVANAGVWADSTNRRIVGIVAGNANNRVLVTKTSTNGRLAFAYSAGGTHETLNDDGHSETTWLPLALTWSKTADQFKVFISGSQVGSTQTGLGTWDGTLVEDDTLIGAAAKTPTTVFNGYIAHVALFGSALSPGAIADLAVV